MPALDASPSAASPTRPGPPIPASMRALALLGSVFGLLAIGTACGNGQGGPGPSTGPVTDKDGDGYSIAQGDCDDNDPDIHPGAVDFYGDGIDANCDGVDGIDADRDGYPDIAFGGNDCDDSDATIHPGAVEIGWDGIDQDCDGQDLRDYLSFDAGEAHTCGVRSIGDILCWGSNSHGQLQAPEGLGFVAVVTGDAFSCALDGAGDITCWGDDTDGIVSDVPDGGPWEKLRAGNTTACAVHKDTFVPFCWGDDSSGQISDLTTAAVDDVGVGEAHICVVQQEGGRIRCFGSNSNGQSTEPFFNEGWRAVTAGNRHTCGMGSERNVRCWGLDSQGQANPTYEPGPYTHLASAHNHNCAVESNVALSCWGADAQGQVSGAPSQGVWIKVAVGRLHSCAQDNKGELTCWGANDDWQTDLPL